MRRVKINNLPVPDDMLSKNKNKRDAQRTTETHHRKNTRINEKVYYYYKLSISLPRSNENYK